MNDDGPRAARTLRAERPDLPIVLLSQHVETVHSVELVSTGSFGYLLKDRVLRVDEFLASIEQVAAGGSVLDPVIVQALVEQRRSSARLGSLTEREREVLALVAEGRSNTAIADRLFVTERTVESHMRSVFLNLQLPDTTDSHRRVLAVLTFLAHRRS